MILASDATEDTHVTIVLGDEFDEALRTKLRSVLQRLGATPQGSAGQFVAGSQSIEQLEVLVDGRQLRIEAETYVGLSVTGPRDLAERVQRLVTS